MERPLKRSRFEVLRRCKGREEEVDERAKKKARLDVPSSRSRRWVFPAQDCSAYKERFVVVSYNILGVENASKHSDLYDRVAPRDLCWDRRKRRIRKELRRYDPSILCFQEVDQFNDLAKLLQKDGYKGVHKSRTGEACDGCAIFWREEKFTLLHQEAIEFNKFGLRDNVAQLCILKMNPRHSYSSSNECVDPEMEDRTVLVGNIHILYNPKRGDIKLGQIRLLLERAHLLSEKWGNIPVVIAGDLNSLPQSAIYQFLASSKLDILLHDRREVSGQFKLPLRHKPSFLRRNIGRFPISSTSQLKYEWNEEEIFLATGSRECTLLQHCIKLSSAYVGVPGNYNTRDNHGEPQVTSYHSKFTGTLDYIWHSAGLIPIGVVETLPFTILRETGGLPSKDWGSDHLAIVCELAFAEDANRTRA
ncbi:hypothetical protein QJS10_CPB14g00324 [Acorus calamus]|uniref:Endonuclease/exonuclease/phosphatase domain-containing protein n=1 Tax=Acorus calamus TaxID=4465 RepID=A0AAV9DCG7_ACOCL|nr:hypothetical protein QJS10_CPB14g00324 [Acorus calamus]